MMVERKDLDREDLGRHKQVASELLEGPSIE